MYATIGRFVCSGCKYFRRPHFTCGSKLFGVSVRRSVSKFVRMYVYKYVHMHVSTYVVSGNISNCSVHTYVVRRYAFKPVFKFTI